MSSKKKSTPTSATSRREALRHQQQAQAKAARRTGIAIKVAWVTGIGVIALMVAVSIWAIAKPGSSTATTAGSGSLVTPANSTDAGAIVIGESSAKVTVSIYSDFMCPYCGEFERANGEYLTSALDSGAVKLEVHPMAFLDAQSGGTKYSTRSANAFVAIADTDPALAWKFDSLLYANQPSEGSSGLTDTQLVDFAQQAGVPESVTSTFGSQTFVPWVEKITQQAFDSGVTGTPTVKINGEVFSGNLYTAGPLQAAVEQAKANAGA